MTTFDSLASTYDADFTNAVVAQHLRQRIHQRLLSHWQADDHILELGCGTGEDALFLAENSIRVTATDVSSQMLNITTQKTASSGRVSTQLLDLNHLSDADLPDQIYDGILSNFGVLNCVEDYQALALWLSTHIKSGGIATFAIMAPYCIWESLWHSLHLDFGTATRRWRSRASFQPSTTSQPINIYYPGIHRIKKDFSPYFHLLEVRPLGLFLPPSDVYPVIEKYPRILKLLIHLDDAFSQGSWLANFADHYWIEFKRL